MLPRKRIGTSIEAQSNGVGSGQPVIVLSFSFRLKRDPWINSGQAFPGSCRRKRKKRRRQTTNKQTPR
jgi:hypothetical protein